MRALLDQTATQQTVDLANVTAKATTAALTGQLIFGYSINEWAAIVGIIVTLTQFGYWIWEKFLKRDKEIVPDGCEI